jgi:hypothetical protein
MKTTDRKPIGPYHKHSQRSRALARGAIAGLLVVIGCGTRADNLRGSDPKAAPLPSLEQKVWGPVARDLGLPENASAEQLAARLVQRSESTSQRLQRPVAPAALPKEKRALAGDYDHAVPKSADSVRSVFSRRNEARELRLAKP